MALVLQFRNFRNPDSPGITQIWNECFSGRGAAVLRHSVMLENLVFAKPYFEPGGISVATDQGQIVGFAHAGFGPTPDGKSLDFRQGILSILAVKPAYQRQGVGTKLLQR